METDLFHFHSQGKPIQKSNKVSRLQLYLQSKSTSFSSQYTLSQGYTKGTQIQIKVADSY